MTEVALTHVLTYLSARLLHLKHNDLACTGFKTIFRILWWL